MSDHDLTLAIVPADRSPSPVTAPTPDQSHDLDTEMTCPLTLMDDRSATSRSSSPDQTDKMNNFNAARERNNYQNQGQAGRFNNMASGGNGNWRQNLPPPLPATPYRAPGQYNPNMSLMSGPPPPATPTMNTSVALSTVCPGAVYPTQDQLNTAFAYGIRRGENLYTRLIPADELSMPDVPQYQGPQGLIILPAPVQQVPVPNMPERMVPLQVVMNLPPVNGAPPPLQRIANPAAPGTFDSTQQRIDSIVNQSSTSTMMLPTNVLPNLSSSMNTPVRRREKIYCDKWIHEGTCAFTQLGCKYLHDMPLDRATQLTIGLNHGLPSWYRREKEIVLRPDGTEMVVGSLGSPAGQSRLQGPWRRDDSRPPQPQFGGGNGSQSAQNFGTNNYLAAQTSRVNQGPNQMGGGTQSTQNLQPRGYGENRNFGPIAPPNTNSSSNPYGTVKQEPRNR